MEIVKTVNLLYCKGSYSATSNEVGTPVLEGGLLHLVHRGGNWPGPQTTQALIAVSNVTAHPSMASVPNHRIAA